MLIGMVGHIGSGKDAAALFMLDQDRRFARFAFADNLKIFCSLASGIPLASFNDRYLKESILPVYITLDKIRDAFSVVFHKGHSTLTPEAIYDEFLNHSEVKVNISPRNLIRLIGTDVMRALHETVWIDFLANKPFQIVTDVRFQNEYDAVINNGGSIIRVVRENANRVEHESDSHIDKFRHDIVIYNDGTLVDLKSKCADALKLITWRPKT